MPGLKNLWGYWGEDETPIRKAQQRFLSLVQLADQYLSEILQRMAELDSFDKSLIIVTSDHGASFRPNSHTRAVVSDNHLDILYVPLFIKLPNQNLAEVNNKNVETIDIFLTVIDLLGGDISWKIDGSSIFGDTDARTKKLAFTHRNGKAGLHEYFGKNGEFTNLKLMSEHFVWEKDSKWNRIASSHDDLLGKHVRYYEHFFYPSASTALGYRFDSNLENEHANFELNAGWLRSGVAAPSIHLGPLDLAVTNDGQIIAITRTFTHLDMPHYFAELLPEQMFNGADKIQVRQLKPLPYSK